MDAQTYIATFITFTGVIVQFLIGIAFLFFVFNAIRFFVAGAGNDDDRARARSLAMYGILAFVILIIFWGVVNLLVDSFGLGGQTMPASDYIINGSMNNPTCAAGQTSVCTTNQGYAICTCQ